MSTSEPQPTSRGARAQPGAARSGLGLFLDLLPLPAVVVDTASGRVVLANAPAAAEPLIGQTDALLRFVGDAAGVGGAPASGAAPGAGRTLRVSARTIPPTDGEAPLALLTFYPEPDDPAAADRHLREAIAARDEFFSVATHELKDPLFSVQLSLQLLRHAAEKHPPVPPHVAHHLDVAGRQVDRLVRLIDNLLDVSRIRSGRLQLDPEALDLSALAREAVGRLRETARAAGCDLTVEADGQVLGYFDRLKLDQALSNLLTNALKYGAGRPVTVRVREAGAAAVLEVEDRGPGVAPADRERIFARFERASDGYKKESLGLGLYIVRSIAAAHGGTATVGGEPGRGATFVVTLPRNRVHHKAEAADGREPGVTT